jgi:excisionase family DNA binding protein
MPSPNAELVLTETLDLEPRPLGAKLTAIEVAQHLKVHPSMVCRMAKRGELPGFKIGYTWRFDRAQIEEWLRSRMHGPQC